MPPKSITPHFSSFLDLCRWVAAFVVFAGHLRNEFFIGRPDMPESNPVLDVWMLFSSMGHSAVLVFFVLSGFLVGGPFVARLLDGRGIDAPYLRAYAVKRLTRLYTVLIPALLLTLVLALLVRHFCDPDYISSRAKQYTLMTFLGNLAYMQSVLVPTFGNNYPLWSLANEFWYYALLPGFYLALRPAVGWRPKVLLISCLGIAALLMLKSPIIALFPIWLLGAYLYIHPVRFFPLLVTTPLLLVALVAARLGIGGKGIPMDILVGISFGLFLNSAFRSELKSLLWEKSHRFNKWFADFSFTLYAAHVPILLATIAVARKFDYLPENKYNPMNPTAWLPYFLVGVFTVLCCYLLAQITEARTETLKKYFITKTENRFGTALSPETHK